MSKQISIKKKKIVVNDKSYDNIEELPQQLQDLFRDEDGDGIPDIVQNGDGQTTTSIEVNGKKYNSWDEVPKKYQKFQKLGVLSPAPKTSSNSSTSKLHPSMIAGSKKQASGSFHLKIVITILIAVIGLLGYFLVMR